jgi:hypothetical protein
MELPGRVVGRLGDPISERPHVWDRNNPYLYSNPSVLRAL